MKTLMVGPDIMLQPGEIALMDSEAARELILGGYAEALDEEIETATIAPVENAARRFARKDKRK